MKVSEAKEKVCPFMSGQVSRVGELVMQVPIKCICSDCIAWGWNYNYDESGTKEKLDSGFCKMVKKC